MAACWPAGRREGCSTIIMIVIHSINNNIKMPSVRTLSVWKPYSFSWVALVLGGCVGTDCDPEIAPVLVTWSETWSQTPGRRQALRAKAGLELIAVWGG